MEEEIKMLFEPVTVANRSRKFKGFGIAVGFVGFYGAVYKYVENWKSKDTIIIWDSKTNKVHYVNAKYVTDSSCDNLDGLKEIYVKSVIESTSNWCKLHSKDGNWQQFARNVLYKYHRELKEYIDAYLPDNRSVFDEVQKIVDWAFSLRTPKGNKKQRWKVMEIISKACNKKRLTEMDGFNEAMELAMAFHVK